VREASALSLGELLRASAEISCFLLDYPWAPLLEACLFSLAKVQALDLEA
jgi:hypothetical protein